MSPRRPRSSAVRQLARLAGAGLAVAGCNALTLDGLQAGSGGASATGAGGQGDGGGAPSVTGGGASSSTASTASTQTSVVASGTGGEGGAGGSGAGGSGGAGGAGGAGGSGGCPDVCAGSTAALCESFDGADPFGGWFQTTVNTSDPVFEVVQDPHVSCPNAASITYLGVVDGEDGGWAQLNKVVPGAPTHVVVTARVWRDTMSPDAEGMFEIAWRLGDLGCYLQVYLAEQPAEVIVYSDQYGDAGDGVQLASGSVALAEPTLGRWADLAIDLTLGDAAWASVTVDGATVTMPLDADGLAECDGGLDENSFQVRLGPPYNQLPTTLIYDDLRVVAVE